MDELIREVKIPPSEALVVLVSGVHRGPDARLADGDVICIPPSIAGELPRCKFSPHLASHPGVA